MSVGDWTDSMAPFWPISHTADLGILVRSADLAGLFTEAAKGLACLLFREAPLVPSGWRDLELEAPDRELLLAEFLGELLFLASEDGLAALVIEIIELGDTRIKASIGIRPVGDLDGIKTEIKAVTYHGLKISRTDQGLEATVIFDV